MGSPAPMLATQLEIAELPRLVQDDGWTFDQKLDGQRRLVVVRDGRVEAVGRRGTPAPLPSAVRRDLAVLSEGEWIIDGELVDDVFWVFDLVRAGGGLVTEATPYAIRRQALDAIAGHLVTAAVRVLSNCDSMEHKGALVRALHGQGCEGIVARHIDGTYEFGVRSLRMVKAKFFRDVDVVVMELRVGGKDNFAIGLMSDGQLIEIGTCSALFCPQLEVGQVVTVQYLYANERGHLLHPTRPRVRSDKAPDECGFDQLIYRSKIVVEPS